MSNTVLPLPSLIRASAHDAGNASARKASRKVWSRADYNAAVRTQDRLVRACYGKGPKGCIKFTIAEQMERAGMLSLTMRATEFFDTINAAYEAAA